MQALLLQKIKQALFLRICNVQTNGVFSKGRDSTKLTKEGRLLRDDDEKKMM